MNSETRTCQNCKNQFTIEPEDFNFYEKIKVPPPTWCPECRALRRFLWRNDKTFYRRKDRKTGRDFLAMFAPDAPIEVMERDEWWSDSWDALAYAKEYDWGKPLFTQVQDLIRAVPWASRAVVNLVRSDYCMNANDLKDCYLVFAGSYIENSAYSFNLRQSKECFDTAYGGGNEISYEGFFNYSCFKAFFSSHCRDSHDILFCFDCNGCTSCLGCVGLRNKSYCIFNRQYSKEEYQKEVSRYDIGSYASLMRLQLEAVNFRLKHPVKFFRGIHNAGVSGEYIYYSKNVKDSYLVYEGENLRYCQNLYDGNAKDSYDHFRWGKNSELVYESAVCGIDISNLQFCYDCWPACSSLAYSLSCHSSSNLFGCIGLRNKQYCILNKQYTKEEYEKLVPKIIEHMNTMPYVDKQGRVYKYGEFFPPELSPFAYNETIAQEYFPLAKEQALAKGYRWKDPETKDYKITKEPADLPDHIKDVDESILKETIGCAHQGTCDHQCTTAFKLIPQELQFYQKMNLPLPRLCPNCRHYERLAQRNPLKLWHRTCTCKGEKSENGVYQNTIAHFHKDQPCPNEFETSYAPDRKEIIYCEQCYNSEVV